mgnify:CR=1 FL=1
MKEVSMELDKDLKARQEARDLMKAAAAAQKRLEQEKADELAPGRLAGAVP